jgi:tRNA G18 (ribose-2'-O)-methylase SpoU
VATADDPAGDPADDLLADYRALNDPATRRQVERHGAFFVVEGAFAIEALLASRFPVRSVLAAEGRAGRAEALLAAAGRPDVPLVVRPRAEVEAVTGFAFHRGLLASAARLPPPGPEAVAALLAQARRVAVLEAVNDHENLGALFRNAAAFGVDAVLLAPTTADPLYRRSVRVSQGHVLHVPWATLAPWPDALATLREAGFTLAALTPAPGATDIAALAERPPDRLAWLLGAEGPGLTAAALAAVDVHVRIPIAPRVDSLNVATAAAIAFHRLAPG